MFVQIRCPQCRTKFNLSDQARGQKVRCKVCQQVIVVPDAEPAAVIEAVDDIQSSPEPNPRRRRSEVSVPHREDDRPSLVRKRKEPKETPSGTATALIVGGAIAVLLLIVGGISLVYWMSPSRTSVPMSDGSTRASSSAQRMARVAPPASGSRRDTVRRRNVQGDFESRA